jgi:hypothetical protein
LSEVFVEKVQPLLPDLSMLFDPADRRIERAGFEPARSILSVSAATDQTGSLEHLQMLRDGLKRDVERFSQLVDRRFLDGQPGEDRPASRVRESGKREAECVCFHER